MNFNQPEEEFLDGDDVVGLGVLGKEGSGRLRIQVCGARAAFPPLSPKKRLLGCLGPSPEGERAHAVLCACML